MLQWGQWDSGVWDAVRRGVPECIARDEVYGYSAKHHRECRCGHPATAADLAEEEAQTHRRIIAGAMERISAAIATIAKFT